VTITISNKTKFYGIGFGVGIVLSALIILAIGLAGVYQNMFTPYMTKTNGKTVKTYNFALQVNNLNVDHTQVVKELEFATSISSSKFSVTNVIAYGPYALIDVAMNVYIPVGEYVLTTLSIDYTDLAGIGVMNFFRDASRVPGLDAIRVISSDAILRINSGGLATTGMENVTYVADTDFVGTSTVFAAVVTNDGVFDNFRQFSGANSGYDIPVAQLSVIPSVITLTFVEIQVQIAGERVFTPIVTVDGVEVYRFTNLDVINEANGFGVPVDLNVDLDAVSAVTASSTISIRFVSNVGNPMISAIEVY